MKRKLLLFTLSLIITGTMLLVACSQPAPSATSAPKSGPSATSAAPTATTAPAPKPAAVKKISLKMQSHGGPTNAYRLALEDAIKIIEQKAGDRIKIDYYPADALVPYNSLLEAVSQGIIDVGQTATAYYVGMLGGIAIFNHMLWNFDPDKFGANYRKIGYYDYMNQRFLKNNTRLLTMLMQPSGDMIWKKKKPIKKMEDLKGLIIYAPTGAAGAFKLLGTESISLGDVERYEGMQRGTIDAINLGINMAVSNRYWEVADGVTVVNTAAGSNCLVMNLDAWKSIPADLQKIIDETFLQAEKNEYASNAVALGKDRDTVVSHGMEVYVLPPAERERWIKTTEPALDDIKSKYSKEWDEFYKMWVQLR